MSVIEWPFRFYETSTNSSLKYNLLSTNSLSSTKTVETAFNLIHDSNVEIKVIFEGGKPDDYN